MRILLVEDEVKVADFVTRALTAESFSVDNVFDGLEGLEFASTYDYDLVILDLMLPKINGTEVLRRLRKQNPGVPVLILTASDGIAEKINNFEAGADDYLTKPFVLTELILRVKALLRRGMNVRASILKLPTWN